MLGLRAGITIDLPACDHSRVNITNLILNDMNYIPWSRNIIRGLAAKGKIDFVKGSYVMPDLDPDLST